jgi:hypothetical protein
VTGPSQAQRRARTIISKRGHLQALFRRVGVSAPHD